MHLKQPTIRSSGNGNTQVDMEKRVGKHQEYDSSVFFFLPISMLKLSISMSFCCSNDLSKLLMGLDEALVLQIPSEKV